MKIFLFFFLERNRNCRDGTKTTGSVGLAVTQVFFRPYAPVTCKAGPLPEMPGFNRSVLTAVPGRAFNSTFERR